MQFMHNYYNNFIREANSPSPYGCIGGDLPGSSKPFGAVRGNKS